MTKSRVFIRLKTTVTNSYKPGPQRTGSTLLIDEEQRCKTHLPELSLSLMKHFNNIRRHFHDT